MSQRFVVAVVAVVGVISSSVIDYPDDKVVFLDVGQGDAILLQNGTKQVLIDGGPGMAVLERLGEEMPFYDREIEVVILTHPQRDHMEGLLHVLERYEVGMVLLPRAAHTSLMQREWLDRIMEQEIPYRFAMNHVGFTAGRGRDGFGARPQNHVGFGARQRLVVGDMIFTILGPFDDAEGSAAVRADLNNASVVTRVDFGELSLLLTGDAEKRAEKLLVERTDEEVLDVDVFKAGHHGSKSSSTAALLTAATPASVVISVGADNRFGHPHDSVLARFDDLVVRRTDEGGSVRFVREGGQWLLQTAQRL